MVIKLLQETGLCLVASSFPVLWYTVVFFILTACISRLYMMLQVKKYQLIINFIQYTSLCGMNYVFYVRRQNILFLLHRLFFAFLMISTNSICQKQKALYFMLHTNVPRMLLMSPEIYLLGMITKLWNEYEFQYQHL